MKFGLDGYDQTSFSEFLKCKFQSWKNSPNLALVSLVVALFTLASAAILIKLSLTEMSPNGTIFNRLWLATLSLWVMDSFVFPQPHDESQLEVRTKSSWSLKQWLLVFVVTITSTTSVVCWAWSLTQTSVANSTVLRNLTPVFTSLGSWLFFRIRFERRFLLGMFIALLGAGAIGWQDLHLGWESIWGDGIALLSAALYAVYLMAVERLRGQLRTITLLFWRCALGSCLMLPVILLSQENLFPQSARGWFLAIALALICQVMGQGLLMYCLKQFNSSLVATFLLLQPVIASVMAWVIFEESLTMTNGLAFILVLLGIYLAKSQKVLING